MIVSHDLFNNVATFRILEPEWFPDHCPMACYLKLCKPWNEYKKETTLTPIIRYIWAEDSTDKVTKAMAKGEIIERLDQVLSITEINESTHTITDILTTIAEVTLIKKNNSKSQ